MAGGDARYFFFQMINHFKKRRWLIQIQLWSGFPSIENVSFQRPAADILACAAHWFFFDVFLWITCTPSECKPWRKRLCFCFVVCKTFDSYNVQFTPLVSDEWQVATARGCNTFWYEVFHQVPFSSSLLKSLNVWHWWISGTVCLISICLIFELTGTCC